MKDYFNLHGFFIYNYSHVEHLFILSFVLATSIIFDSLFMCIFGNYIIHKINPGLNVKNINGGGAGYKKNCVWR